VVFDVSRYVDSHIREYGRRGVCARRFGPLQGLPELPMSPLHTRQSASAVPAATAGSGAGGGGTQGGGGEGGSGVKRASAAAGSLFVGHRGRRLGTRTEDLEARHLAVSQPVTGAFGDNVVSGDAAAVASGSVAALGASNIMGQTASNILSPISAGKGLRPCKPLEWEVVPQLPPPPPCPCGLDSVANCTHVL